MLRIIKFYTYSGPLKFQQEYSATLAVTKQHTNDNRITTHPTNSYQKLLVFNGGMCHNLVTIGAQLWNAMIKLCCARVGISMQHGKIQL